MNCFISTNTDIYYNLALEEFLLKNRSEDFFFLWRSTPVAVIGKHQNPYKEIDYLFARENNIKIARRFSGGGTVYQDLNNINFTIIKNTKEGKQINLKQHSKPIYNGLISLGLDVEYSKRNDFLIDGKKLSGNAEHVYKNRVLHHGTILFDSDLKILDLVLKSKTENYTDKTIPSVRSQVTNLKPYFNEEVSIDSFQDKLFNTVLKNNTEYKEISIPIDIDLTSKYSNPDWIFGYTPKYEMKNQFYFDGNLCTILFKVEKGEIKEFEMEGINKDLVSQLKSKIIGQKHLFDSISETLKGVSNDIEILNKHFF